jgi:deazaflavin-dependent oxidoreductase (nitroreductase family)
MFPQPTSHWWHAIVRNLASLGPVASVLSHLAHRLDQWVWRRSNGRTTLTTLLTGVPVVTLTTTGAKSGQPRTVPLVGIPDDAAVILIASNFGGTKHPAWYHNLRAYPQATVAWRDFAGEFVAEEVTGAERERCWQKAVQVYPGYNAYKTRTGGRQIPVLRLRPLTTTN